MFSAFNPSKCTHLEQWAADCASPGEQSWTSCRSRDLNSQPWVTSGFEPNALSIRSRQPCTEQAVQVVNIHILLIILNDTCFFFSLRCFSYCVDSKVLNKCCILTRPMKLQIKLCRTDYIFVLYHSLSVEI